MATTLSRSGYARQVLAIVMREWKNFLSLDKGILIAFFIVVAFYGLVIGSHLVAVGHFNHVVQIFSAWWWLLFSVVVSSMFSNAAFVAERVTGAIEILLTCGFVREAVLMGKVLFSVSLGAVAGVLATMLSLCGANIAAAFFVTECVWYDAVYGFLLLLAASWFNACCIAWLSVRLENPRLSQFVNFVIIALIGGGLLTIGFGYIFLAGVLAVSGTGFFLLAARAFHSERVVSRSGI